MRRRAVDGANREAAQPVVVQLAVPHPEAQQDAVDVVLGGRLRRKDSQWLSVTFTITQSAGAEVFLLRLLRLLRLPASAPGRTWWCEV